LPQLGQVRWRSVFMVLTAIQSQSGPKATRCSHRGVRNRAENHGWGLVIVLRATNGPVFGLGLALRKQNLAWTGHLVGPQSLVNKNMDSPEAQPYPL
jgi:hypothetical protein